MGNEVGHTPGPWPVTRTGDGKRYIIGDGLIEGPGGYEVAEVYADDCDPAVALANANLIGAAPDLLRELINLRRRFHNCCLGGGSSSEYVAGCTPDADDAIARATGAP